MGRYFRSLKEYELAGGSKNDLRDAPSIDATGSVRGMRKLFWGYDCDVVRTGGWIYKVPSLTGKGK